MTSIERGQVFSVSYPFCLDVHAGIADEFHPPFGKWRPGIDYVPYGPDDVEAVAHGMGVMLMTVVDVFHPKPFPPRVFFTRKYQDPDGKVFGKNKLHIWTREKFLRISRGFHVEFKIVESES